MAIHSVKRNALPGRRRRAGRVDDATVSMLRRHQSATAVGSQAVWLWHATSSLAHHSFPLAILMAARVTSSSSSSAAAATAEARSAANTWAS